MGTKCISTNTFCVYIFFILLFFCSFSLHLQAAENNTISQGQLITDGQVTVSASQNFALGFFSPINSTYRYLGIWYYKIPVQTVIWVANRDKPIYGESSVLTIGNDGNLMILDGNTLIWSTNISSYPSPTNTSAILMDSGNLLLFKTTDVNDASKALWGSFAEPTDTYLPEMRVYTNVLTGKGTVFSSWRSDVDPSYGNYSLGLDPRASPQIIIWNGLKRYWRSGHWNGIIFTGLPGTDVRYLYGFRLTNEGNGNVYFTYTKVNSSTILRFKLRWDGLVEQLIWDEGLNQWSVSLTEPSNEAEVYNLCSNFGIASSINSHMCDCMEGFNPKYINEWNRGNWSNGCTRRSSLHCNVNGTTDGFLEVQGLKLPDFADILAANKLSVCREKCLQNCSCNAYTFVPGIGCMIWSGDLVDIEQFKEGGNTLYVRAAKSELGDKSKVSKAVFIAVAVLGSGILGIVIWLSWRRFKGTLLERRNNKAAITDVSVNTQGFSTVFSEADDISLDGKQGNGTHLPLFSFSQIELATDQFANKNKLGEGGFGPVYKGTLQGGQEVAVKRLSKWSGQGVGEFKTELILIAKLQHRNLVRLLGCCIEGEEKLLIYEYMPNKSLDSFLFDSFKKAQLDWQTRFAIIEGIARGLLYLHRDSRLRIIHRDLKASNILLDEEMNPKISDFGMARIFGGNQNEANTVRVVGTYGYMSPEYAMEGLFSVKSDVYSFGILLLEIVTGQRNRSFHSQDCSNLIRYAWSLWKDNKAVELIDPLIVDSCCKDEALRCIHVAMLCVQSAASVRPEMPSVVMMLESGMSNIEMPRQLDISLMSSKSMDWIMLEQTNSSSVEVQITEVTGR